MKENKWLYVDLNFYSVKQHVNIFIKINLTAENSTSLEQEPLISHGLKQSSEMLNIHIIMNVLYDIEELTKITLKEFHFRLFRSHLFFSEFFAKPFFLLRIH